MSEQRHNRSHSLVLEFWQNKAHQTPEEINPWELSIFIFWLARLPLPNTVKLREKTKQIVSSSLYAPLLLLTSTFYGLSFLHQCFALLFFIIPFSHLLLPLQRRTMAPILDLWLSPLLSHDMDSGTLSCWVQSTQLNGYAHSTGGNITRPLSARGIWTERTYRCACVTSVEHILHIRSHKQVGGIWSLSEWRIQLIKTAEKETSDGLMFLMFSCVMTSKSVRLRHGLI